MDNHSLSFSTINGLGETIVLDVSWCHVDDHLELTIENEDRDSPEEDRIQFFILNPKQREELKKFLEQL